MEKEQSSFEKKLIRIKESGFWEAFRFAKDGKFKSTLLIYSFSMSIVYTAIYIAAYWFLIDPIEFGLRAYLGAQLRTLVESFVPALLGSVACCAFHFVFHDKRMVLFTYGWMVVMTAAFGICVGACFTAQEMAIIGILALRFIFPPLGTGIALAAALYIAHRRSDPYRKYQDLPSWKR